MPDSQEGGAGSHDLNDIEDEEELINQIKNEDNKNECEEAKLQN